MASHFDRQDLGQTIRFVATVVGITCLYGIALDMVTAHIWVAYFTVHHPKVVESKSPVVMALVWGVGASWWFGAIAGTILWLFNRSRPEPVPMRTLIRWVVKAVAALWLIMMSLLASIYLLIGLLPISPRRLTFEMDRRAMSVALTHMTEYVLGAIVLILLMLRVSRKTRTK